MRNIALYSLVLITLVTGFAGCSHYHLGHPKKLPFETLYVKPVENNAYVPQAQALLSDQLIQALQREGMIKLVPEQDADAILIVTLKNYDRSVSATQETDTVLASSISISLTAECTLKNLETDEVYFEDREVSSNIDAVVIGDPLASEYQNLPSLTQRLADKIRTQVISYW